MEILERDTGFHFHSYTPRERERNEADRVAVHPPTDCSISVSLSHTLSVPGPKSLFCASARDDFIQEFRVLVRTVHVCIRYGVVLFLLLAIVPSNGKL